MRQEEIITLPNLVRQYLNYLSGVKSKSMLTVLEYGSDLRLFFRYISKSRGLADKHTPFDEINISLLSDDIICTVSLDEAYGFLTYCRNENKTIIIHEQEKQSALKDFINILK